LLGEDVQSMDNLLSALIDVNRMEMGQSSRSFEDFPLSETLPACAPSSTTPRPAKVSG